MTDYLPECQRRRPGHAPVWFMRRLGEPPEYRELRAVGRFDAIAQPELSAEITLQPVRRHNVDAAVLFSDIVVPVHAIGFGIDVTPELGRLRSNHFGTRDDLQRLPPLTPEHVQHVTETLDILVNELRTVPLLHSQERRSPLRAISSRVLQVARTNTKAICAEPQLWHDLMECLSDYAIEFISAQLTHGARFQLFDSWAGSLSALDYDTFVAPHSTRVLHTLNERHADVPESLRH